MKVEKHKKEDYPYIFRLSPFYVFYTYLSNIVLLVGGVFIFVKYKEFRIFGIIMFILSLILVKDYNSIIKPRVIIKLNHKGIWTKKFGFIDWSLIKDITFYPSNVLSDIMFHNEVDSYSKINIYLFNTKNKTTINITGLEKKKSLKQLINHFLDLNTFEKQQNLNKNWDRFV